MTSSSYTKAANLEMRSRHARCLVREPEEERVCGEHGNRATKTAPASPQFSTGLVLARPHPLTASCCSCAGSC